MSRTGFRFISLFLAFVLANSVAVEAQAQEAKRIVVGFAPGGNLDSLARKLATGAEMKSAWGSQIFIENLPGSFGLKAAEAVRGLPKDGSIILAVTAPESGDRAADYERSVAALADFVPIAYLGSVASPRGRFWYGFFGPPGMPPEIARRLETAVGHAMRSSEMTTHTSNIADYRQDRPVSAVALAQAIRASALAADAAGATAGAGGAQQPGNANAAADDPKVIGGVLRP